MTGKRTIAVVAMALALLVCFAAAVPGSTDIRKRRSKRLARGVRYVVIRDKSGPFRIRVVKARLSRPSTIDTVLATDRLPGFERTSSMARRSDALVAINGDYARASGRPVFTFAADGHIAQTPLGWGRNFSTDQSETLTFIGHPEVTGWVTDNGTGTTYPIERVNEGAPQRDQIARFTRAGGREERPPAGACQLRAIPQGFPRFALAGPGVESDHVVDKVRCGGRSLRPQGGSILATPPDGSYAPSLSSVPVGSSMTLGWSLGWPEVLDTIGGNPTLIEDGRIIEHNVIGEGSFFRRHPRTGVGTTPEGKVLFVVVDGRQPGYSVGMTLKEFADLFASLGADWALNLDGGGSTTMVINGSIVNRPSNEGRRERAVSSALVLLPAQDDGEESEPPMGAGRSLRGAARAETWRSIAADPASTGGLR
ncbi:MAG: phosphodiester glycosidase family protein, partial [Actinomycetota bacterium]